MKLLEDKISMNLDDIDLGESLDDINEHRNKEATTARAEFLAKINKEHNANAKKARELGIALVGRAIVPSMGEKTPDQDYNCRLYSVLNMIKNPSLSNRYGALAATWQELYPHIPYNSNMTNKKVSARDRDTITKALKDAGMYKRFKFDSIGAVIALIKQHAMHKELVLLREQQHLQTITLDVSPTGNWFYNGVEIQKLTRCYKVQIDGASITVPHSSLDKLVSLIDFIDTHEE